MGISHLLLIEDDRDIACVFQGELQDAGYQVSRADSVVQGLWQATETSPDLVITDLGLPDGDGRDIVSRLRLGGPVPIIVLTARDDLSEKVELLDMGASDYLIKPVSPQELLSSVAVQLRAPGGSVLRSGPLALDAARHQATLHGEDLGLSDTEFRALGVLMRQPGRVYARQDLARRIWEDRTPTDGGAVDMVFSALRDKLRRRGGAGLIRAVKEVGYALRAPAT